MQVGNYPSTPNDGAFATVQHAAPIDAPTSWPGANARLLGLGQGLPVNPLDRLGLFSAVEFERFILEWAEGYLKQVVPGVDNVQQRGGAGDKGRDIVVWFGAPGTPERHWKLYQAKRYASPIGPGIAAGEIAKVLFYAHNGDYSLPSEYWFVTHKGVTGDLQDLIDEPAKLKAHLIKNWDEQCAKKITSKKTIALDGVFRDFVEQLDYSFVRVKQPLELIAEHGQTRYHPLVFGAPLIERPKPADPPSQVAEKERLYVRRLFDVISEITGEVVNGEADFASTAAPRRLFERSRLSFYSAEGLKELARDNMDRVEFFEDLLTEFEDGLYHHYTGAAASGYIRLTDTIKAAQVQQIAAHVLEPHMTARDREGVCHHLANDRDVSWCDDD